MEDEKNFTFKNQKIFREFMLYIFLESTKVMILASPMHFHNISGPLQSVISRIYAMGKLKNLKKCGMLMSAIESYLTSF